MWKLEYYKIVFVTAGLVGVLLFASPTLGLVLHLPEGERFSELWILGSEHMAEDYPFNVRAGEFYKIYLGIGSHMGSSRYYTVYVKLRNQTEQLPNSLNRMPSDLPPIYEFKAFVVDGGSWEKEITFSLKNVVFDGNACKIFGMIINGITINLEKTAFWDDENHGYYFQLFFELWIYNSTTSSFQFHNRFVGLWFNITNGIIF